MKRNATFLALLILATHECSARALNDQNVRKQLEEALNHFSDAYKKKDIRTISGLLAHDFVSIQSGVPPMTRQQVLTGYQKEMSAFATEPDEMHTVNKLSVIGDRATTEGTARRVLMLRDNLGKVHAVAMATRSRLGWARLAGHWVIKKAESWDVTVTIDGKLQSRISASGAKVGEKK